MLGGTALTPPLRLLLDLTEPLVKTFGYSNDSIPIDPSDGSLGCVWLS